MRPVLIHKRWTTTAIDKALQDPVDIWSSDAACQFSITETTRSAFAEQVVVLVVVLTAGIEMTNRRDTFFHGLATFDDQRTIAFQAR